MTGAYLVFGLKYGGPDTQAKEKTYELVREFAARLTARKGTLQCKDLIGCDISTPEGWELAKQKKLFSTVCVQLVRDAAQIVDDLMENR